MAPAASRDLYSRLILDLPMQPTILIGHALYMIHCNRRGGMDRSQYWLKSFLMAVLRTNGGSTIRSLLLGQIPPWLSAPKTVPTIFVLWYLMMYWPKDQFYAAFKSRPVLPIIAVLEAISKVRAITGGVDAAVKACPNAAFTTALLLGTVSGCGGTLLSDIERKARGVSFDSNLHRPGWILKMAFYTALFYYLTTKVRFGARGRALLEPDLAKVVISPVLIASYVIRNTSNPSFNLYAPLEKLWYAVTRIPAPR